MSFLGFLSGAVATVAGVFKGAVSLLGTVVPALTATISPVLGLAAKALAGASALAHTIAQFCGVTPPNVTQEELGARAVQNSNLKPENFDSHCDFINALCAAPFDRKAFEASTQEQKDAYRIAGFGIESVAVGEKLGIATNPQFYAACARAGIKDGAGGVQLINSLKSNGIHDTSAFTEYVEHGDSELSVGLANASTEFSSNGGQDFNEMRSNVQSAMENETKEVK